MTGPQSLTDDETASGSGSSRLALLLAMAMFVLVVDTSLMNVSISAVVEDLDTTVSGVQSAIALEALVSAAFILIGSKVGDLIGRKRAYVLGLLGYAIGALAMTVAQGLTAIIVFWAIIGGLGASLLLPAMQSLIHGNFEGAAQRGSTPWSAPRPRSPPPSARCSAASSPPTCRGASRSCSRSWSSPWSSPASAWCATSRTPVLATSTPVGAVLSVLGMGGLVLGILVWQEGGEAVGALLAVGAVALARRWPGGCVRRKREGKPTLHRPRTSSRPRSSGFGVSGQMLQQIALGGTMIALPIFLQMVLEYDAMEAGLSIAPLSLSMFAVALLAGRKAGGRAPERHHPVRGSCSLAVGLVVLRPDRAPGRLGLVPAAPTGHRGVAASGCWSRSSTTTRWRPISEERVSEAAGVNSAAGSFGLSFGLAFAGAIMLAALSITFTAMADASTVLPPDEKEQVAEALEDDAELMSNTQLEALLAGAARRSSRTRSSASTPMPGRSPCRSRCSSRSSPPCSGCSTRSGWLACPTCSRRRRHAEPAGLT